MKIGLVSLGCSKNLIDSEMILGMLENGGAEIVPNPEEADLIIINTCGFIEEAKKETIATIKEMAGYHKKLIVTGCYAQRYQKKLEQEMPFVDKVVTLKDYPLFGNIVQSVMKDDSLTFGPINYHHRLLATSHRTPYLKLSDGCDNRCTYCAIPLIRGRFRSRDYQEVLDEASLLVQNGAKEINLISQDTTRFGYDVTVNHESMLPQLLRDISQLNGLEMVRILYLYPDEITDELIFEIKQNPKICPYFDIPLQHVSNAVLKRMNRRGSKQDYQSLLTKIREHIPQAILRTTMIVGFPGETEEDFQELIEFVKEMEFDRLGAFAYSKEEDTPAFDMPDQIEESIKLERLDQLMNLQQKIAYRKNKKQIHTRHRTIIEDYDPQSLFYYGRSYAFAPDDIDGYIVFQSTKTLMVGDIVTVEIKAAHGLDLIGDAVEESGDERCF